MASNAGPAFLSRISREFTEANAISGPAAREFSPIEFDEYIGNINPSFSHSADNDESQFDVTLPWDVNEEDEGEKSDHAHEEEENISHGPQHQQRQEGQRVTPHGTMTSILSAAEYTSKVRDQNQHQHGNNAMKDQQRKNEMQQRQEQVHDTQKYQKSLRLRAAKYFRAVANPTASCDSLVQNRDNLQPELRDILDERPETAGASGPQYRTYSRRVSQSHTPTIHTTNQTPCNPAKRNQSSQNKPSLDFFPRTRVVSPPNPSSRNSPTFSIKSSHTTHTDTRTEVTTAMTTISRYSDPPLSTSGMSRYSDPSLLYEDMQSQVSTSATSVSYGSDLENAARKILGRKRGFGHGDASSVGKVEVVVEKHVMDTNASLTGAFHSNRFKNGVVQRRPSRERLQKKTGRSIGLPTREVTDDEAEEEEETEGEEMDVLHPLPPSRNLLGLHNSENMHNHYDGYEQYQSREETCHVRLRNQFTNSNDIDENEIKQKHARVAFPTPSPDLVKQVDAYNHTNEENSMTNTHFAQEWNIIPPVSRDDHDKAFFIAGDNFDDDDYKKYDDQYDAKVSNLTPVLSIWDNSWYQTPQFTRASCASSLEGDAGEAEESENDCGEFNEHDYFHDFGMTLGQSWESLPAPVQFSPTRGVIGGSAGYNNNELDFSQTTPEQHEDYVNSTSEIDFFTWNDEECPTSQESVVIEDRHRSDNILQDQIRHSFHHRTNNPNLSTDVLPDPNVPGKNLVSRDKRKEIIANQALPSSHEYPFSDGDTPTRKTKRGLNLFRSRFRSDVLKYHSEGESLDNDLESPSDKHTVGVTPMRSTKRNTNQKAPPLSLSFFGERHQHRRQKVDKENVPFTEYELLRKDSELSNSGTLIASHTELMNVRPVRAKGMSTVNSGIGANHSTFKQVTPESVQVKLKINRTSVVAHNRNGSKDKEHSTNAGNNVKLHKESISSTEGSSFHADSTPKQGDIKPVSNLNDSLLTEETPLVSNKAFLNDLPPAPSLNQSSSSLSDYRNTNSSSPLPGLPPRFPQSNPAEKKNSPVKRKQPQSNVFTGADVIVSNENVDDCSISTLQSDSLGSLVTKATTDKSRRSVSSQRSGMSEIERLRKENERLREELEHRSEISSRVSSTIVKALKEENEYLREELINSNRYNVSQNSPDMMHKSTIARLLELDDSSKHRRSRFANLSNAPKQSKQHLNSRKPSVPLINGADFDDESITTQSESMRYKQFQFAPDNSCDLRGGTGLLQKIATVADQIKTSTQERNNSMRGRGTCEISLSKPLKLVEAFTRKDEGTGETSPCANTVSTGKEVIGRVLGCIKQYREGDKTANSTVVKTDSFQSTKSDSASNSLVHRTAIKQDAVTSPGAAGKLL